MKGQNKRSWGYGITRRRGQGTIQKSQQLASCCCTTGQSRHSNPNRLSLILGQRNRPNRVAQSLQVAADPRPALLIRDNPQLPEQLGVVLKAGMGTHQRPFRPI
tara:strand:- start:184 stop:495 length:312 start_codon:yes stop_codon:yes gene_type:complete